MIDFSRVKVKYGKGNFCKSNRGLEKKKEKNHMNCELELG